MPTAGLRGRLPKREGADKLPLRWAHEYLTVPLPVPNYPVDVSGGLKDWGMLGNDTYGDCGEAGQLHVQMATAIGAGVPTPQFSTEQAVNEYLAYTGGQDSGVVLADFLLWLYKKGEILAFAPVDHASRANCDGLMEMGHGLYCGVNLTDQDEADFGVRPWGSEGDPKPDSALGHCIVKIGADGAEQDAWVTWGAVQLSTTAWTAACLDESWLIVTTQEQLAKFEPSLLGDIQALGGTGGETVPPAPVPPAPEPPPTPEPPPAPEPPPEPAPPPDPSLLERIEEEIDAVIEDVEKIAKDVEHYIVGEPVPAFGPGTAQRHIDSVTEPGHTVVHEVAGSVEQDNVSGAQATVRRDLDGNVVNESIRPVPGAEG